MFSPDDQTKKKGGTPDIDCWVDVAIPRPIPDPLTYHVPKEMAAEAIPGMRAIVPLGRGTIAGMIVAKVESVSFKTKAIVDLPDPEPALSQKLLDLTRWISDYYLTPWGEVIRASLPGSMGEGTWTVLAICKDPVETARTLANTAPMQAQILDWLGQDGELSLTQIRKRYGGEGFRSRLAALETAGFVRLKVQMRKKNIAPKTELVAILTNPDPADIADAIRESKRAPKQASALKHLVATPKGSLAIRELESRWQIGRSAVNALTKRGLVHIEKREVIRRPDMGEANEAMRHELTADQKVALEGIKAALAGDKARPILLSGVTGSGKTVVYLEAIEHVLEMGMGAMVLVPEIALTPQTFRRFRSRFGDRVAVLHSQLSAGERSDAWRELHRGRCQVVVGPRSAIFAPVENLRLIIVDEEHDSSYKQTDPAPRYHARDVAVARGKMEGAVVVLGSATPSLESHHNADTGKYERIYLKSRIASQSLPEVTVVDMRIEKAKGNFSALSTALREAIAQRLEKKEQIVLLQNRRGFSPVQCSSCGETKECDACQVAMTYHRVDEHIHCHYCGSRLPMPTSCAECGEESLGHTGMGTQRVQESLETAFPGLSMIRMDQDTTRQKGSHHRMLESFRNREASLLLGTQMVAKGLDFPDVTLVGVISADIGLAVPDFRTEERVFQLLTQVAGRSGRGDTEGHVIIQTLNPNLPAIEFASRHDVEGFAKRELTHREPLGYPPFGRLVWLLLKSKEKATVERAAKWVAEASLRLAPSTVSVKGPASAPLEKLEHNWRFQVLLSGTNSRHVRNVAADVRRKFEEVPQWKKVRLVVDVDPAAML